MFLNAYEWNIVFQVEVRFQQPSALSETQSGVRKQSHQTSHIVINFSALGLDPLDVLHWYRLTSDYSRLAIMINAHE